MKQWLKITGLVIAGLIAFSGFTFLFLATTLTQPVSGVSQPAQNFDVPTGQAASVIANRLAEAKLIRHPFIFRLELKRLGLENKLQAGSFMISPSMHVNEIAKTLTTGTSDVWVTMIEGWRREEVAESLVRQELPAFDEDEFLELTANSEGMLFPDTYLLPRQVTAEGVYDILTTTFDEKVVKGLASDIANSSRSFEDILVMASLIEREAREYGQMRMVSGILWNRIDIDMALNVDATLQYAKGYNVIEKSWWTTPTSADKQLNSPFNTYLYPELPPQPIANPGLDAIKAALNPTPSDNYYYLHDPKGNMHYATTLEGHNRNIERYLR